MTQSDTGNLCDEFSPPIQLYEQEVVKGLIVRYVERTGRGGDKLPIDIQKATSGKFGLISRQVLGHWLSNRNDLSEPNFNAIKEFVSHSAFQTIVPETIVQMSSARRAVSVGSEIFSKMGYISNPKLLEDTCCTWLEYEDARFIGQARDPDVLIRFYPVRGYPFLVAHALELNNSFGLFSGYLFAKGPTQYEMVLWDRASRACLGPRLLYRLGDDFIVDAGATFLKKDPENGPHFAKATSDNWTAQSMLLDDIAWNMPITPEMLTSITGGSSNDF